MLSPDSFPGTYHNDVISLSSLTITRPPHTKYKMAENASGKGMEYIKICDLFDTKKNNPQRQYYINSLYHDLEKKALGILYTHLNV